MEWDGPRERRKKKKKKKKKEVKLPKGKPGDRWAAEEMSGARMEDRGCEMQREDAMWMQ